MPTLKVRLADGPTRVMNALYDAPQRWADLRDTFGATSWDMNLLLDLGFVTKGPSHIWPQSVIWRLTDEGRAAMVPSDVLAEKRPLAD